MADINDKIISPPVTIPPVHCCDEGGGDWGGGICYENVVVALENNCNMAAVIPTWAYSTYVGGNCDDPQFMTGNCQCQEDCANWDGSWNEYICPDGMMECPEESLYTCAFDYFGCDVGPPPYDEQGTGETGPGQHEGPSTMNPVCNCYLEPGTYPTLGNCQGEGPNYYCSSNENGWVNCIPQNDSFSCPAEEYPYGCNGQCRYASGYWDAPGCMDPSDCNYDPDAKYDDGSCIGVCVGCTNTDACNYDPDAVEDDGSCQFNIWCYDTDGDGLGCPSMMVDDQWCNSAPPNYVMNCEGDCDDCPYDYDDCGVCGGDGLSCIGCTDPEACNYDSGNIVDDGSCYYLGDDGYECSCDGSILLIPWYTDDDGDGIGCCRMNDIDQVLYFCEGSEPPGWSLDCSEYDEYCLCNDETHTIDDCGVCYPLNEEPPNHCYGCTNPYATNYSPINTIETEGCSFTWLSEGPIEMKMWYWHDDGYCSDVLGVCEYSYWTDGPGSDIANETAILTEYQCVHIGQYYGIDFVISSSWSEDPSIEQHTCSESDPAYSKIYMWYDGSFSTSLTKDGSECPGTWEWVDEHKRIQFTYSWSGGIFSAGWDEYLGFNDLTNGFHGEKIRIQNGEEIPGRFYVRKWDFHPMLKGAPGAAFLDRVWSSNMYMFDPETGEEIKSLPIFESDRTWHSMNGESRGEFEITPNKFKLTYINASDDSCCSVEEDNPSIYDISSPEIGGGKICSGYTDNQFNKQPFPGCRSVVSSISLSPFNFVDPYTHALDLNIFPGMGGTGAPQGDDIIYNRKWQQLYDTEAVMRTVTLGTADIPGRSNYWFYGSDWGSYDFNQYLPSKNCISGDYIENLLGDVNGDGSVDVLDIVILVSWILGLVEMPDNAYDIADINTDENINILDVVALISMILSGGAPVLAGSRYTSEELLTMVKNLLLRMEKKQAISSNIIKMNVMELIQRKNSNKLTRNKLNSMTKEQLLDYNRSLPSNDGGAPHIDCPPGQIWNSDTGACEDAMESDNINYFLWNSVLSYQFGYPSGQMQNPSIGTFSHTSDTELPSGHDGYVLREGTGPILISVPHAQSAFRPTRWNESYDPSSGLRYCNGDIDGDGIYEYLPDFGLPCAKSEDFCTGAIGKVLKDNTDVHIMYTKYLQEDPNYYDQIGLDFFGRSAVDNFGSGNEASDTGIQTIDWYTDWVTNDYYTVHPYKQRLLEYVYSHPEIKLVIDLHGSSNNHGWDVDIGTTGDAESSISDEALSIIVNTFQTNAIGGTTDHEIGPISINDFSGGNQFTVTKFIKEQTDIESVQLEIARIFRCVDNNYDFNDNQYNQTTRLITTLIDIISYLNDHYSGRVHGELDVVESDKKIKRKRKHKEKKLANMNNPTDGGMIGIIDMLKMVKSVTNKLNASDIRKNKRGKK